MNYFFLVFFGLLTIYKVNNAWNIKGPRPFWQNGPVKSLTNQYQQRPLVQQTNIYQDEASAEPAPVIPQTSFVCEGKPYLPGMYADTEVDCRVYHFCVEDRKESFFCGEGTVFNQKILTCDYPKDTNCAASQRYWSANEELGKPGAEPGPAPNKKIHQQFKGGSRPSISQQPFSQKQYQPYQQSQQAYDSYEDKGFVNEPVKKIRPTYKVVKTNQQTANYRPQTSVGRVLISPAKSKIIQEPVALDVQGPVNYERSDSYFSQQQTSGDWQPSSQKQYQPSTSQLQHYYTQQEPANQNSHQFSQRSYKQETYGQTSNRQYSSQSNVAEGWRSPNRPGGGYSYNDINEQKIDINIPQTNFDCEGKPYEPGMYADIETGCSIYHVCFDGRKETFACGKGTVFNQKLLVCDYPHSVKCSDSPRFYSSNENLVNENGNWILRQPTSQQTKIK